MDPVHIFLDPRSMDPLHGLGLWTGDPCFVLFPMFAGHQCLWKTLVVVKYKKGKWLKLVKSKKHLTVVEFTKPTPVSSNCSIYLSRENMANIATLIFF